MAQEWEPASARESALEWEPASAQEWEPGSAPALVRVLARALVPEQEWAQEKARVSATGSAQV